MLSCNNSADNSFNADPAFAEELFSYRKEATKEHINAGVLESLNMEGKMELRFYDPDTAFRVRAKVIPRPSGKPIIFETTTERRPGYFAIADLTFNIGNHSCRLTAYSEQTDGRSGLFIPFRDLSSGKESYGGGRYMDVNYNGEFEIILDFNRAYNPYCHYNHSYSCPLVPDENFLDVMISAGERKYTE